ncbi:MAG: Sua5/YciO/YrdC/YwlC family protein [Gammaproteobacteria bacterium]|nr:Sua5/YciO/YrdC/YwlC family protein [Gammaproteobacteria bacterium]
MSWHIREAVRQIAAGGIIAYPTETVYGLGCDPFNGQAVLRLLELKQRRIDQGVILVASDLAQLEPLLLPLSAAVRKRVTGNYSRPVTWVLPCPAEIPVWLRGVHTTLAVRITRHPIARALCASLDGPLVSTSANLHGGHPATTPLEVHRAFGDRLDYILHGPVGADARPSEIRDGLSGKILRA